MLYSTNHIFNLGKKKTLIFCIKSNSHYNTIIVFLFLVVNKIIGVVSHGIVEYGIELHRISKQHASVGVKSLPILKTKIAQLYYVAYIIV